VSATSWACRAQGLRAEADSSALSHRLYARFGIPEAICLYLLRRRYVYALGACPAMPFAASCAALRTLRAVSAPQIRSATEIPADHFTPATMLAVWLPPVA
jgi:hypothetical protein